MSIMNKIPRIAISFVLASATADAALSAPLGLDVHGQVFVVTRGQQVIKLPLVEIYAIPEAALTPVLTSRVTELNATRRLLEPQILDKRAALESARAGSKSRDASDASRKVVDS